jgi:hypothetical protein
VSVLCQNPLKTLVFRALLYRVKVDKVNHLQYRAYETKEVIRFSSVSILCHLCGRTHPTASAFDCVRVTSLWDLFLNLFLGLTHNSVTVLCHRLTLV